MGICDPVEQVSKDAHDSLVKEQLQRDIFRERDGRYVIKLPLVDHTLKYTVPTNKDVAHKRLISMVAKLEKSELCTIYGNIFGDWLEEGIVETHLEQGSEEHYLPHRPVFKPNSLTTPVRSVQYSTHRVTQETNHH